MQGSLASIPCRWGKVAFIARMRLIRGADKTLVLHYHIWHEDITGTDLPGAYLEARRADLFLLGPDAESEQWVERIARNHNLPHAIAHKDRFSGREVRITAGAGLGQTHRNVVRLAPIMADGVRELGGPPRPG